MLSPDQRDFAARLISEDVIGFHAQQAVEKSMKAVLVVHGVAFRRAHDLSYLLQVAEEGGVEVPENVAATRWPTPWAAEFRYDEHEIAGFSRTESRASAERAIEWAQGVLDGAE